MPTKKIKAIDPIEISQRANHYANHFVLYPTPAGYRFAYFYRSAKEDVFEILAASHKAHKLKSEAIKTMKKTLDGLGSLHAQDSCCAFDHKGEKISLKIVYDVKKLL